LFVPKIPSFKVTDIASLMAPGLPQKEIGIRPGEKLHEIMVPFDENSFTIELEDRYIIQPQLPFWTQCQQAYAAAKPVDNTFVYSSDTNPEWLSEADFLDILGSTEQSIAA
jgi:UDP-N-acetylglucosamine 4,6-dehydratase